jgi:hypothetical protein
LLALLLPLVGAQSPPAMTNWSMSVSQQPTPSFCAHGMSVPSVQRSETGGASVMCGEGLSSENGVAASRLFLAVGGKFVKC